MSVCALKMQIFHFLVGNADAHAKNYALLHPVDASSPSLAPLYDVVCTAVYPQLTKNIAMRIGGRHTPDTIQRKHWLSLVPGTKASQQLLTREMTRLAKNIVPAAETLLTESNLGGFNHPLLRDINNIIRTRAQMILQAAS